MMAKKEKKSNNIKSKKGKQRKKGKHHATCDCGAIPSTTTSVLSLSTQSVTKSQYH